MDPKYPKIEEIDEFLDVQELSNFLKVKPGTIYAWVYTNYLPEPHKFGRLIRFPKTDTLKWIQDKRPGSKTQRK